jgi:aminoglycoside/choline kinase family phosphotransferase
MIARYASATRRDLAALRHAFFRVAAQRKLKDAGRFVFIDRVRKNPDFLRWYPQSLVYAGRALRTSGYLELSALIERHLPGFPDHAAVPAATSGA